MSELEYIEDYPIKKIKPYERNARKNDAAVPVLINAMQTLGNNDPIEVNEEGVILAGHTRYKALKEQGCKTARVIVVKGLTEEQQRAYRLEHNKTNEIAQWDDEILMEELEGIEDINMEELGFDNIASDEGITISEGADDIPEIDEDEEPTVKVGEVWKLGDHYLICGNATLEKDVNELIKRGGGGLMADMVFTDPPYNVALGSKNSVLFTIGKASVINSNRQIIGDGDDGQTDEEVGNSLWEPAFTNLRNHAKDQCSLYVTMPQGGTHMMMMMMMIAKAGWQVKHELMWMKNVPAFSMNRLDYDYQHEPILYGWNKTHKWIGKGKHQKSVWQIDRLQHCDLHPTMKPVELIANAILNSTDKGDVVMDVFGGSGSTLIACEETGRKCRMMELDPHYCDVIIKRWENLTGQKAVKIEG